MTTRRKLTKAFVDSLDTPGFYWDTEVRGFGIRIGSNAKSYIVQARVNGTDRRRTLGRHGIFTAEEARKKARVILAQMAEGVDPKEAARDRREEGITLNELFTAYLARRKLAPRTERDYRGYMARYFADWQTIPITGIKPNMIETRHSDLGRHHGEAQADVAMRCLRALFNFAEGVYTRKNGDPLILSNPTKRLSALKQWFNPNGRETYIHIEKFSEWYHAVKNLTDKSPSSNTETIRDYLLLIMFTGLRRTEASLIQWDHVDFEGRRLFLPRENTKNRSNVELPLTTFTFDLLKCRRALNNSDFVFPGSGKTGHIVEPRFAMRKVIEATGTVFTLHDLRRTYATFAGTVIDNPWTVKRLMNHLTGQDITQRYMQGVERLRDPAQRVCDYMLALIPETRLETVI